MKTSLAYHQKVQLKLYQLDSSFSFVLLPRSPSGKVPHSRVAGLGLIPSLTANLFPGWVTPVTQKPISQASGVTGSGPGLVGPVLASYDRERQEVWPATPTSVYILWTGSLTCHSSLGIYYGQEVWPATHTSVYTMTGRDRKFDLPLIPQYILWLGETGSLTYHSYLSIYYDWERQEVWPATPTSVYTMNRKFELPFIPQYILWLGETGSLTCHLHLSIYYDWERQDVRPDTYTSVYTMTGRDRMFDLPLPSQCGSMYNCLSRSVPENDQHVAGMLSYEQTTSPLSLLHVSKTLADWALSAQHLTVMLSLHALM